MLKFGAAKSNITPEKSMVIPGHYSKRFASDVIDNLYAKAMVFENNGTFAVTVVCDTINLRRDDVLRIRRGISEKYISVSASHTHTGGPSWHWHEAGEHDAIYMNKLVNAAVDAACIAFKKRVNAKIGFAKCNVPGYTFIRRYLMKNGRVKTNPGDMNPDIVKAVGKPDESFVVGKVTDENEKVLAFISNYGVHLDMVGGNKISADYPGYLASLIAEKYGDEVESVFFTGPCGNTNHINPLHIPVKSKTEVDYSELPAYKKTAHALFDALCEIEGKITLSGDIKPIVSREFLSARLRVPSKEYVETAQRFLNGEDVCFEGYSMEHLDHMGRRHIALGTLDAFKNPIKMIDVEVMTLTLGDNAIVAWPAEVFVEYGMEVRERFADKNIIISELSNGTIACYLPTEDAIEQGGYEPTITGAITPEPKIGTDMVNATIKLLEQTW